MRTALSNAWFTLSNMLTCLRLFCVPFIVKHILYHQIAEAFLLFIIASVSDLLDGYAARRFGQETVIGSYLDPIADKALLVSCFYTLVKLPFSQLLLPRWFVILVVVREVIIVCGAIVILLVRKQAKIEPLSSGKVTTASYMLLIGWIFLCYFCAWVPLKTFYFILGGVAAISMYSLCEYTVRAYRLLRG